MNEMKKFLSIALMLVLSLSVLAGCGNSGSNAAGGNEQAAGSNGNGIKTMKMKEYFESDPDTPKLIFWAHAGDVAKDEEPYWIYILYQGKVGIVDKNSSDTKSEFKNMTFGDIAKLSNEELIELAKNNTSWQLDNKDTSWTGLGEYIGMHVYTDASGNSVIGEALEYIGPNNATRRAFGEAKHTSFQRSFPIYDKTYIGFEYDNENSRSPNWIYLILTDGDIELTFDEIGTEGVEVD